VNNKIILYHPTDDRPKKYFSFTYRGTFFFTGSFFHRRVNFFFKNLRRHFLSTRRWKKLPDSKKMSR